MSQKTKGLLPNAEFNKDFHPITVLSQHDANTKLREEELRVEPLEELGVSHYDIVRVPSNFPVEDDLIHGAFTIPGKEGRQDRTIMFWGIFDGHEGWEMSTKLRISLMDYVSHELKYAYQNSPAELLQESLTKAIETAFKRLDDDVINAAESAVKASLPLLEALPHFSLAYSGSCAIFSMYDSISCLLRVACVGDSRAVLGRRKGIGEYETIALSADQNLHNPLEVARLQDEHPNEPDMIKDDCVLGMAITRAFGDGRWKYRNDTQKLMQEYCYGRRPRPGSLTAPYLIAEPVVNLTEVQPGKDFMILGSDGLWDRMKSEQAVMLVGKWLDEKAKRVSTAVEVLEQMMYLQQVGSDRPPRSMVGGWQVHPGSIIVVDDNAATHLARNALGGADDKLFRGLLTFRAPFSRSVRDDITVQVVFFGNSATIL